MAELFASSFVYNTVEYYDKDGKVCYYAEIVRYTGSDTNVVVPCVLDGIVVRSIGREAFMDCDHIKWVDISSTVRDICFDAFNGCSALEYVHIPKSVAYIGNRAFMGCTSLKSVSLHATLDIIGDKAFGYDNSGEKTDGFKISCKKHTAGYRYAKANRFAHEKTGELADPFRYSVEELWDDEKECMITAACITGYCGSDDNVIVPSEIDGYAVRIIDGCAFAETAVKNVIIPDGVEKILSGAFRNCKKLESVFLPETLSYIGSYAFSGCDKLSKITVPKDAEICKAAFDTCA